MTTTRRVVWTVAGLAATIGLAAVTGSAQLLPPADEPAIAPAELTVPTAGRHRTVITVTRAGRYAIVATSAEGVTLQLDDRMTGPGGIAGDVGEQDGRLDVLLEAGGYRLTVTGDEHASGEAVVTLVPYREANPVPAPRLVEFKPVDTTLGDREQRSWWLEVSARRWVHLEAGGRTVGDLRLWRDGSWLVTGEPERELIEPVTGRPLQVCRLAARLEPGLYLVTAAGGAPVAWANDDGSMPLHLRYGVPSLGDADRRRYVASPFGIDRFRLPGSTTYLRLELPDALPAAIAWTRWDPSDGFAAADETAAITRESRLPVVELWPPDHTGEDLVTVRLAAGEPYVLQHFHADSEARIDDAGWFWIGSIGSGHPADSIPATGILVDNEHHDVVATQTVTIGRDRGWRGRCNLLAPLSLHLAVTDAGSYVVEADGGAPRVRLQPFLVSPPQGYRAPPFRAADSTWQLDPGLWVLEVEPEDEAAGIVELTVRPADTPSAELAIDDRPGPGAVRLATVRLESRRRGYTLYLNQQPEVVVGPVLRARPIRLDVAPLPLVLRPGESLEVPVRVGEPARLEALAEDGSAVELELDGGGLRPALEVAAGEHTLTLRHPGDGLAVVSLAAVPLRLLAETPLPPLPAARLAALPEFPRLTAAAPHTFHLARDELSTWGVTAPSDGLYRLESTGLLDTEGTLRGRITTDLGSATDGGSGRNFLLHRYLAAGSYQLSLATRGSSAGHLGLALERTEPRDGGVLAAGQVARDSLAPGEAVRYRLQVAEAGSYRVQTLALGRTPPCRLDDADGWPVVVPASPADLTVDLEPGEYGLLLLPEPVAGRRVTVFERIVEPVERVGHGPFELPLDETVRHRWTEPAGDGGRIPDGWRFELAAATTVAVELDPAMRGRLLAADGGEVASLVAGRGWRGPLKAGAYRLEVVSARPDNRREYSLAVRPEALVPGLSRSVSLPATVPVAFNGRPVEITTLGTTDLAARLTAPDGRLLAAGDDRPGDWNVLLAGAFPAGPASLELVPVGAAGGMTTVAVTARPEAFGAAATLPLRQTLAAGGEVDVLPLPAADRDGVLLAVARSAAAVGLAVEVAAAGGWRLAGQRVAAEAILAVPLAAGDTARLRVWSADRRGGEIEVRAVVAEPTRARERTLARGLELEPVADFEPPTAVAAVELTSPGVLRLVAPSAASWSSRSGVAAELVRDGLLAAPAACGWLVAPLDGARRRLETSRVSLSPDHSQQLRLAAGEWQPMDVVAGGGDLIVARASAMAGRPLVAVADLAAVPDLAATAVAAHAALAAGRGERSGIHAALAGTPGDGADVRLDVRRFELSRPIPAAWGRTDGVAVTAATLLDLPPSPSELRLTLAAGVAAVVLAGGQPQAVVWGGGAPLTERLVAGGDQLAVVPLADGGNEWALELTPGTSDLVVAPGATFRYAAVAAGRLRLAVAGEPGEGEVLAVDGADGALFLGADGTVAEGLALATGGGPGILWLTHARGRLSAWFGPAEAPALGLWDRVAIPPPAIARLPLTAELDGGAAAWQLELSVPAVMTVVAPPGAAVRLCAAGSCRAWLGADGARHLPVAPGSVELAVSGAGPLMVTAAPVTTTGEGLGPERLLAAGDVLAYRFSVPGAGRIGVGVRADPDTAECRLLDAAGRELGSGVVQVFDLEAGDYLLLVSQPETAGVSRVRPAVVGLERPPDGPPDKVVRRYLELERSTP